MIRRCLAVLAFCAIAATASAAPKAQDNAPDPPDTADQIFADAMRQSVGGPARVDLGPEAAVRLAMERLTDDEEVALATSEPPHTTRAYFRGRCLERFSSAIVAANWDSVVFDVGEDSLRRVPMMEPLKGTARHVDTLFEGCESPSELLRRLGS